MYLDKSIENHLNFCEGQVKELKEKIAVLPEGTLHVNSNNGYFSWRITLPGEKRRYVSKKDSELIKALALKSVLCAQLKDLENEAVQCRKFLKSSRPSELSKLLSLSNPEIQKLIKNYYQPADEKTLAWINKPFEKSEKHPEQLLIPTLKEGEMVRSKLEASAANTLFSLKIPYKYEKVTMIGNIKIAVDFTALDIRTYKEVPIELFGLMDNPEYVKNCQAKLVNYIRFGYYPGLNMLTFYETSHCPLGSSFFTQAFENFFFKNPPAQL